VAATVVVALASGLPLRVLANSREAEVKAAYVYKLASFVRWPPTAFASAATPTTLCVSGRRDVLADLTQMVKGQRADDRALVVVAVPPGSKTAPGCQALYLGEGGRSAGQLIQSLGSAPVLTISDRGAGSEGGVIELVDHGDTVRLVIHRAEASRRGLTLSSKLLSVAEAVEP